MSDVQGAGGSLVTEPSAAPVTEPAATTTPELSQDDKSEAVAERMYGDKSQAKPDDNTNEPEVKPTEEPAAGETKEPETETKEGEVTYDLKLPDDSAVSETRRDEIVSFAKEQGLSNDVAQQLLEQEHNAVKSFETQRVSEFETLKTNWANEAKTDSEIGGEQFDQNLQFAKDAINKYGSDKLNTFFDDSGFGNNPELIRVFSKIGKAMDAGQIVHGGQTDRSLSMAERMYGKDSEG